MNTADFRNELTKIMPGYQWTIQKESAYLKKIMATDGRSYLKATGIQSSGFNRLSTLQVERRETNGTVEYEVKSSGFGKRASWLSTAKDGTLARALRALQTYYENMAATYGGHARDLQLGRKTA